MREIAAILTELGACAEAVARSRPYVADAARAWAECQRGDWMLWLLGRVVDSPPWSDGRKKLVLCALDCACTVQHLWPAAQSKQIAVAVETLRAWTRSEATISQAKTAKDTLWNAKCTTASAAAAAPATASATASINAAVAAATAAAVTAATVATVTVATVTTVTAADAAYAYAAATAATIAAANAATVADADAAYAAAYADAADATVTTADAATGTVTAANAAYAAAVADDAARTRIRAICAYVVRLPQHYPDPPVL